MAAYEVELTARARKQYKALDPVIRDRIRRALLDLADDPAPSQVKALAGGGGLLRIRVGVEGHLPRGARPGPRRDRRYRSPQHRVPPPIGQLPRP